VCIEISQKMRRVDDKFGYIRKGIKQAGLLEALII
jgi:hypothetical protein